MELPIGLLSTFSIIPFIQILKCITPKCILDGAKKRKRDRRIKQRQREQQQRRVQRRVQSLISMTYLYLYISLTRHIVYLFVSYIYTNLSLIYTDIKRKRT